MFCLSDQQSERQITYTLMLDQEKLQILTF